GSADHCANWVKRKKRNRHTSSPTRRDLPLAELLGIVERAKSAALSETDYPTLKTAVDTLAFLTQELAAKGTTIERLRKMLFGASTEKTSQVVGGAAGGSATTPSAGAGAPAAGDEGEKQPKAPGHGRNGAEAYLGADKIK